MAVRHHAPWPNARPAPRSRCPTPRPSWSARMARSSSRPSSRRGRRRSRSRSPTRRATSGLGHVTAMGGADLQGVPWPAIGALLVLIGAGLSSDPRRAQAAARGQRGEPGEPGGRCRWRPRRGDRGAVIGPDRLEGLTIRGIRTAAIVRCVRPESPPAACRPMRSRARHPPVPCPALRQRVDHRSGARGRTAVRRHRHGRTRASAGPPPGQRRPSRPARRGRR